MRRLLVWQMKTNLIFSNVGVVPNRPFQNCMWTLFSQLFSCMRRLGTICLGRPCVQNHGLHVMCNGHRKAPLSP